MHVNQGFGLLFASQREAEEHLGSKVTPAPMGTVSKARDDGSMKHRVILDLRANGVNLASSTPERQVLPSVHDHAKDLAVLGQHLLDQSGLELWTLILDVQDAFMGIPLAAPEQPYNGCATDLPIARTRDEAYPGEPVFGHYVLWAVLGFGGKPNPLVFARAISFASRAAQAMLRPEPSSAGCSNVAAGRLQFYVDDPCASFLGSSASAAAAADLIIGFWLVLGLPMAWKKGSFTAEPHTWIGGLFSVRRLPDRVAGVVTVPPAFADGLFEELAPFAAGKGHIAHSTVERVLGKCGRLAYLVPGAKPFVSSLWGALAGSQTAGRGKHREAPPGRHAARRFGAAARWLRTLLRPPSPSAALLPLEHLVVASEAPITKDAPTVEFDASPWGGGAVLKIAGQPQGYIMCGWTSELAEHLGTQVGSSAGQTTWELLMVYISLLTWASQFRQEGLVVFGDNIAALSSILTLRGRNHLATITRELAWRRVRFGWRYAAAHLPSEYNVEADALSRVHAPEGAERKSFPVALRDVTRHAAPAFEDMWVCS